MDRIEEQLNDGWDGVRKAYPPILTTAQVAEMLDLNVRTVLAMANDGRLPASRLADSRKYHFLLEDVIKTLQANRVTDQQPQPAYESE
jgi:excisionase family DNA binding protein